MIERLLAADAALERGEIEAAERLFTQVAGADPRNAIAVVGLARVAARRGETEAARVLARRALEIDPDEAAARRLLGDLEAPPPAPAPEPEPEPDPELVRAVAAQDAPPRSRSWVRRLLDRLLGRG